MFLKSLTLKGFKSFADPAVLEFEPGVTVVVGPNGSGKSNVVDAVAWVLGAQGPRTLRSAKMEDVIFAGSSQRPALGRAEVTLTIDNSAHKLATDLAELTITRTLFRSGDSEYAMNGTPCRLLDIQELLSDTGVGRQQHVIISQGHLDAVLEARPEDRRAVIEEAAGVLKHRRRRERAERRLAATEENLERLFDLVREVKRQIRPLERQAAAARSYAGLAEELKAVRLYTAGTELRPLDVRRLEGERLQEELGVAEADLGTTLAQLDADSARTADELSAERESDLAASLARAEGMVERARGLAGVLRERQRSLAVALDAAADADVVSTLEAEGARLTEELSTTGREERALAPEQEELAALEAAGAAELESHLAAWGDGGDLRGADEALAVARAQLGSLEHSVERDRRTLDQLIGRLSAAERRASALEGQEHELSERLAEHEQERHRLQSAVADAESAHRAAVEGLERAEETLREAEQDHARSVARADALERALDEARGGASAELLAGIDGVVGTLFDLVDVDRGWEEAFEAAAGAALAAVVVSGSESARTALSRLRRDGSPGAVLALTESVAAGRPSAGALPPQAESIRTHVRPRGLGASVSGLDLVLDTLLAGACCAVHGWSEAIDVALARPDLVVVTREGDRFSSTGWRVRAAGAVVTAELVDEARARAEAAQLAATRAGEERALAHSAAESSRQVVVEAVRADDRNELAHQTARAGLQRVGDERAPLGVELEEIRRDRSEVEERIARDGARVGELAAALPALEEARVLAAERVESAREERRRIDEVIAGAAARRGEWEVRSAGILERKRVLAERLAEVERRLTGHAEERREAAARRERLETHSNTVGRLLAVVASAQDVLDVALGELRARHQRQREAVRAGGVKLEELRRRRTSTEQDLATTRTRRQETEVAMVESAIRRESLVETLRRELAATPDEALAAGRPALAEGVEMAARAEQLEAEIAAIGPVNPLALDELSELGERHRFLEEQVDDVRRARRDLHQVIRTLDDEIMQVFAVAFADVNEHFSNLVTSLFPGGTGRLSLTEPENLLDTGVEVEVRPAGRNVRRLSLLSGGERSLVAMAYLFAVFRSRPSPFYLMDEVEAALDDVNLMRFLALVHEFREEAQLIIVSHQKRTMEAADALYGVTMAPGGSSKVLSQKVPRQRGETDTDAFLAGSTNGEFAEPSSAMTGPVVGAPASGASASGATAPGATAPGASAAGASAAGASAPGVSGEDDVLHDPFGDRLAGAERVGNPEP
jgi:chromosome segregation protein